MSWLVGWSPDVDRVLRELTRLQNFSWISILNVISTKVLTKIE